MASIFNKRWRVRGFFRRIDKNFQTHPKSFLNIGGRPRKKKKSFKNYTKKLSPTHPPKRKMKILSHPTPHKKWKPLAFLSWNVMLCHQEERKMQIFQTFLQTLFFSEFLSFYNKLLYRYQSSCWLLNNLPKCCVKNLYLICLNILVF